MAFTDDLATEVAALCGRLGSGVEPEMLLEAVSVLGDEAVFSLFEQVTRISKMIEQVSLVTTGVIGARSARNRGHKGVAQERGFRNVQELIRTTTGVTRAEAAKQVRVATVLVTSSEPANPELVNPQSTGGIGPAGSVGGLGGEATGEGAASLGSRQPWHAPLGAAYRRGQITSDQHDAIFRGLGNPPGCGDANVPGWLTGAVGADGSAGAVGTAGSVGTGESAGEAAIREFCESKWREAAEILIAEAAESTVEDLARRARAQRDLLDPIGAEERFRERYEQRSFTIWTGRDGLSHGKIVFDDASAAMIRTALNAALRPRTGGPRFMTDEEHARAEAAKHDARKLEQLSYDTIIDILSAGIKADPVTVFGTRQAGVRLVQVVDREEYLAEQQRVKHDAALGGGSGEGSGGSFGADLRGPEAPTPVAAQDVLAPVGCFEDDGATIPASVIAAGRCESGVIAVTVDRAGNPLDLGREQRTFSSKQRIALAVRDGGCRWSGCDRPASYCEAHHIDHWEEGGRTDIDRGILLCRFHHLQLHNNSWRITRDGLGPFVLRPPRGKRGRGFEERALPAGRGQRAAVRLRT